MINLMIWFAGAGVTVLVEVTASVTVWGGDDSVTVVVMVDVSAGNVEVVADAATVSVMVAACPVVVVVWVMANVSVTDSPLQPETTMLPRSNATARNVYNNLFFIFIFCILSFLNQSRAK